VIILGINAHHGDAAAAVVVDGRLVAAIEEERLNRKKHCAGFPTLAVQECLRIAGASLHDVDHVALNRDPSRHVLKKALYALTSFTRQPAMVKERFRRTARVRQLREEICGHLGADVSSVRFREHRVEHHRAHVASAYHVSPFEEAACLSVDGFGDFVSTLRAHGRGDHVEVLDAVTFPHSLGIFYTMITQFIGFRKYGDEGKVMGLAPYGSPRYMDLMRRIVRSEADGLFSLDTSWFRHASEGVEMTWEEGTPVIGQVFSQRMADEMGAPREPGSPLTDRDHDLAASLQVRLQECVLELVRALHRKVPSDNLCLAGGVALNCVTVGMIPVETPFKHVFVQGAAGDSGGAIGAAFSVLHEVLGEPRRFVQEHLYVGPEYDAAAIDAALEGRGLRVDVLPEADVLRRTAQAISEGKVVGWFQGRMEFGPRALGNRSIVADPRRPDMKDILNRRVKHREPFRPFAPSVQEERTSSYFEVDHPSPFMGLCVKFREEWRGRLPAVDHVDHTGRLQTVSRRTNPRYWGLIEEFRKISGVALVLNTSFNENEPIVCTPKDAVSCFTETGMDLLVMGDRFVTRA